MIGTAMRRREEGPERGEVPPKCDLGNVDLCLEGADLCYESFGRMNLKDLEFYVEGDGTGLLLRRSQTIPQTLAVHCLPILDTSRASFGQMIPLLA